MCTIVVVEENIVQQTPSLQDYGAIFLDGGVSDASVGTAITVAASAQAAASYVASPDTQLEVVEATLYQQLLKCIRLLMSAEDTLDAPSLPSEDARLDGCT